MRFAPLWEKFVASLCLVAGVDADYDVESSVFPAKEYCDLTFLVAAFSAVFKASFCCCADAGLSLAS
jgi:hypothetical protein